MIPWHLLSWRFYQIYLSYICSQDDTFFSLRKSNKLKSHENSTSAIFMRDTRFIDQVQSGLNYPGTCKLNPMVSSSKLKWPTYQVPLVCLPVSAMKACPLSFEISELTICTWRKPGLQACQEAKHEEQHCIWKIFVLEQNQLKTLIKIYSFPLALSLISFGHNSITNSKFYLKVVLRLISIWTEESFCCTL